MRKIRGIFLSVITIFVLMLMDFHAQAAEPVIPISEKGSQQTSPTLAKGGMGGFEQSKFSLEVKDNLINLQAKQTSVKEILIDLEKKTGIKIDIFSGVEDKKIYRGGII